jgi:hypothetical protein
MSNSHGDEYDDDSSSISSFSSEQINYIEAPFINKNYIYKYVKYIEEEIKKLYIIDKNEINDWAINIKNSLEYFLNVPDEYEVINKIPIEYFISYIDIEQQEFASLNKFQLDDKYFKDEWNHY